MSFGEPVTFTRLPARSHETGDRTGAPTEVATSGCGIEPLSAAEVAERSSDRNRTMHRLYSQDIDLPVRSGDIATFRGQDHVVDGDPERWASPFTSRRPGCVVTVWREVG